MKRNYKVFTPGLTVRQFQNIFQLAATFDLEKLNDMDKISLLYYRVFGIPEEQFNNLTVGEVNALGRKISQLLLFNIPGKPKKYLSVGGKRYAIEYDPAKFKTKEARQLIEYASNPVGSLHFFLASISSPVEYGIKWWKSGFKRTRHKTKEEHAAIAQAMLDAPLTDVYATCAQFCYIFTSLIKALRSQFKAEMMQTGIPEDMAETLIEASTYSLENFFKYNNFLSNPPKSNM